VVAVVKAQQNGEKVTRWGSLLVLLSIIAAAVSQS
jgi:hypothetical protein